MLLAPLLSLAPFVAPGPQAERPVALDPSTRAAIQRNPLAFEENVGQSDARVRFLARNAPFTWFLTDTETVLRIDDGERQAVLRTRVVGGRSAELRGEQAHEGISRYFVGDAPESWGRSARHFGRVVAEDVLPGVDQVFYGTPERHLEYDFVLDPGVDPGVLRVELDGALGARIDDEGRLVIDTEAGELRQSAPVAYQERGGVRVPVASRFALEGTRFGFVVGAYDPTLPLTIDPTLTYSTYLGGSGLEMAWDFDLHGGVAYLVGHTTSSNFPLANNSYDRSANGGEDCFLTVLAPGNGGLISSTYFGGSAHERALGIEVDGAGIAHICGWTDSSNFPITSRRSRRMGREGFVTLISPYVNGNQALSYSTYLGGDGDDSCTDIDLDPGASFNQVTGTTRSDNFPVTASAYQPQRAGGVDGFYARVNQYNDTVDQGTYFGGRGDDWTDQIRYQHGNLFCAGWTWSSDFPVTSGAYDTSYNGAADTFCLKLAGKGSLLWSTYVGGSDFEYATGLHISPAGEPILCGETKSRNFPTTSEAYDRSFNGGTWGDATLYKLNQSGSALVFSTLFGGSGSDSCNAVVPDSFGNLYVCGHCDSSNLPMMNPVQSSKRGNWEAWAAKFNSNASSLMWSTYFGTSGNDAGFHIELGEGTIWVAGYAGGSNLTTTPNAFDRSFNGGNYDATLFAITQF